MLQEDGSANANSSPATPTRDQSQKDRYERLRDEAARQGMKMLEEERERNTEMNELLKARVEDLEQELEKTRQRLGKKVCLHLLLLSH
jgi:Trm5-related predicted tRNA methylase